MIFFFLNLLRPLYNWLTRSRRQEVSHWLENEEDPYHAGMVTRFNLLYRWIFEPYFKKVHVDLSEVEMTKKLADGNVLVYIAKNRGQLEYSFFNQLFLKEGLPLSRFANGTRTLFWKPFKEICRSLVVSLERYYNGPKLPSPLSGDYLKESMEKGSVQLHLKVSNEWLFGVNTQQNNPAAFLPALIHAAKAQIKPVILIPQQFLYDRHPSKDSVSMGEVLFGERSNPGTFRKLIMFFLNYRLRAVVKIGTPFNLTEFIAQHTELSEEAQADKLRKMLLEQLDVEQKSITGPTLKSKEYFLTRIQEDVYFQKKIKTIGEKKGQSPDTLMPLAKKYFYEIASDINFNYVAVYSQMIRWLTSHVYDGLDIDIEGLNRIKAVAGKNPIVLVPSHKSHVDYLLLSYLFYNSNLTMPHVCAGINLNFWPVGNFLRKAGAFFIRRSIRGNELYQVVLEHYLKALIKDGFPVEFFIEGTRSRTGKLLKPRTGILSMITRSYLEGINSDIYFVPIAINYEKIMEEKSYTQEMKGAEKEKENVSSLLKAGNKINKRYGRVSIQFAEPFSLKQYFEEKKVGVLEDNTSEWRDAVEDLGLHLTYNINRVSVVTSPALLSLAALNCPTKGLPQDRLVQQAYELLDYLNHKGARLSQVLQQNPEHAVRELLSKWSDQKILGREEDLFETFYTLSDEQRIKLAYHKNTSIHFFVSLVCFLKVLSKLARPTAGIVEMEREYEILKQIFHFEFTFSERSVLRDHFSKILFFLQSKSAINFDEATLSVTIKPAAFSWNFFAGLLDDYFEAYWLTLYFFSHVSVQNAEPKALLQQILEAGQVLYRKGEIKRVESLSRFMIENALSSYQHMGLIEKNQLGQISQQASWEEIRHWLHYLETCLGRASQKLLPTHEESSTPPLLH